MLHQQSFIHDFNFSSQSFSALLQFMLDVAYGFYWVSESIYLCLQEDPTEEALRFSWESAAMSMILPQ